MVIELKYGYIFSLCALIKIFKEDLKNVQLYTCANSGNSCCKNHHSVIIFIHVSRFCVIS